MTAQIEQTNDEYKIICKKCQHFIRVDKGSAEKFENEPESFECELCFVKPGEPKLVRSLIHCATCTQTYDSRTNCECEPPHSTISIIYDPKNVWMRKDRFNSDPKGYNAETTRIVKNKERNKRLEAEQRQIRVDKNLELTVELLQKLVDQTRKKNQYEKFTED